VWWRDPRFRDLLHHGAVTFREICLTGRPEEQRHLWAVKAELEARMRRLAALPLERAVASYIEALSGQHGIRSKCYWPAPDDSQHEQRPPNPRQRPRRHLTATPPNARWARLGGVEVVSKPG
jgi:hypothetical protein